MKRQRVDNIIEKNLLTGLIVSNRICKEILPILNVKCLKVDYTKRVITWIKTYYLNYKEAPQKEIQNIFDIEKKNLEEEEALLIKEFLNELSVSYLEDDNFNEEYLIDRIITYIKERELEIATDRTKELLSIGKIAEAEASLADYRKIAKITSNWVNPLQPKEINKAFDREITDLFNLPGKLGELAGTLERGMFIGFLGPFKRGKTWWLLELAMLAIRNKLKVVFVSLEMDAIRMERRIYQNISSAIDKGGNFIYSCFDCQHNQDGTCSIENRTNDITLIDVNTGNMPLFNNKLRYKPCTYCRTSDPSSYKQATWFTMIERPAFDLKQARKSIAKFSKMYGKDNFRLKAYPRFSANLTDVIRDLDILEYTDKFIPDVIIIDYADILTPEPGSSEKSRDRIDDTWKTHAKLASERKCLVVTVSQSTRNSWDSRNVRAIHAAEDYRKMANVDIMFSLNQTSEEKKQMKMRFGVIAHRHRDFNELNQVTVLNNYNAGQAYIDSEITVT